MAGISQIIPFGTAPGAGVLAYADYQALPARLTGFVNGTADPVQANTAWRQASVFASAIAQFIVDKTGLNVLDDGDVEGLELKFGAALAATLVTSTPPLYSGTDGAIAANSIDATVTPALSTPPNGGIFVIRNNYTNTGPMQMRLNGGQYYPCVKGQGAPMAGYECFAGDWTAWTFTGAAFQLLNDKTVSQSLMIAANNTTQLQQAIVAVSQMDVASNAIVTIQLAAVQYNLTSITGALSFAHANGLQIHLIGAPLKNAVPTGSQINAQSNSSTLTLLRSCFATEITAVGVDALQIRGVLGSVQNCLFSGDGTASGGHYGALVSNWGTSIPDTAVTQFINCAFHGFGLDCVHMEQGGFIQANNLLATYATGHCIHIAHSSAMECNVGNVLAMYGQYGIYMSNQGLFAVDSASGNCDISRNTAGGVLASGQAAFNVYAATGFRIQNNGGPGITCGYLANVTLCVTGTTQFSGNAGSDIAAYNVSNVLTYGCALPSGSTPSRGSTGNNGCSIY
jgi:hypothetical protein